MALLDSVAGETRGVRAVDPARCVPLPLANVVREGDHCDVCASCVLHGSLSSRQMFDCFYMNAVRTHSCTTAAVVLIVVAPLCSYCWYAPDNNTGTIAATGNTPHTTTLTVESHL